jgi:hypothetical protein
MGRMEQRYGTHRADPEDQRTSNKWTDDKKEHAGNPLIIKAINKDD